MLNFLKSSKKRIPKKHFYQFLKVPVTSISTYVNQTSNVRRSLEDPGGLVVLVLGNTLGEPAVRNAS